VGGDDVEAEAEVGDAVGEDGAFEAFLAIDEEGVYGARDHALDPAVMFQAEEEDGYGKGKPGEGAEGHFLKIGMDEIAKQKGAPEKLLHDGRHQHSPC